MFFGRFLSVAAMAAAVVPPTSIATRSPAPTLNVAQRPVPTSAPASGSAKPAEAGRVAFLLRGSAYVESFLATSPAVALPLSGKATWVSLASNGRAVYGSANGVRMADPPYRSAKAVALPPAAGVPLSGALTRDGKQLGLHFEKQTALLDLASGRYTVVPFDDLSGDATVRAYTGRNDNDYNDLFLETSTTAPPRPVFTIAARDRVFAALRAQRSPAATKIADDHQGSAVTEGSEWLTGRPALAPDGEALYWTTNLGGGAGAAGNTEWLIMKTDVTSGRTIGLTRTGIELGRMPDLEVSADGRKLLATWSIHSSAVENPVANEVIDLASQRVTHLSHRGTNKNDVNIQDGQCWAADSTHMAYSGYYYDPSAIDPTADPTPEHFTLFFKDVATNKTVRMIDGATRPSCA